jgi:hypothetical protein
MRGFNPNQKASTIGGDFTPAGALFDAKAGGREEIHVAPPDERPGD